MSTDTKPTNPKDVIGSTKMDLGLVPYSGIVGAARAFLEGALKYGRFNWRIAGVRSSIYHAALLRHVAKWWNGQDFDTTTHIHHLDNAIACLMILRDAEVYEKLNDDRPPCPNPNAMADFIDEVAMDVAHLKNIFKAHDPHQYTIADTSHDAGWIQLEIPDEFFSDILPVDLPLRLETELVEGDLQAAIEEVSLFTVTKDDESPLHEEATFMLGERVRSLLRGDKVEGVVCSVHLCQKGKIQYTIKTDGGHTPIYNPYELQRA